MFFAYYPGLLSWYVHKELGLTGKCLWELGAGTKQSVWQAGEKGKICGIHKSWELREDTQCCHRCCAADLGLRLWEHREKTKPAHSLPGVLASKACGIAEGAYSIEAEIKKQVMEGEVRRGSSVRSCKKCRGERSEEGCS